jgi:hypothetical protein
VDPGEVGEVEAEDMVEAEMAEEAGMGMGMEAITIQVPVIRQKIDPILPLRMTSPN